MGSNTLDNAIENKVIPIGHHNGLVQALLENLVPRNASRVAEDLAGQLGESNLRWLRSYIQEMFVGDAASGLKIYEGATGELWIERAGGNIIKIRNGIFEFWVNGTKRFSFDSTFASVNGNLSVAGSLSVGAAGSIPRSAIASKAFSAGAGNGSASIGLNAWHTIFSADLNNMQAGKKVLIYFKNNFRGQYSDISTGATCEARLLVNGSQLKYYSSISTDDTYKTIEEFNTYTIPSTGNFNFSLQVTSKKESGSAVSNGIYRVEEM